MIDLAEISTTQDPKKLNQLTQSSKSRSHEEFKTYKLELGHPVGWAVLAMYIAGLGSLCQGISLLLFIVLVIYNFGKQGEPIKCEICHKLFKRMCTLKHHLATVHVEEKPFNCDVCDYRAKAARFVFRHKQQGNLLQGY